MEISQVELNPEIVKMMDKYFDSFKAISFDDVTFEKKPSNIHPDEVNLTVYLSKNISLKSGGMMDYVATSKDALRLARKGGMGIILRYTSPEDQVDVVKKVRSHIYREGRICNPVTFNENIKFSEMKKIISEEGYKFTTFPIVNKDDYLTGFITSAEMSFAEDKDPYLREIKLCLGDTIYVRDDDCYPCGGNRTMKRAREIMKCEKIKNLPVVDLNDKVTGMYIWDDIKKGGNTDMFSLDDEGSFLVGAVINAKEEDIYRIRLLVEEGGCKVLVIDATNELCQNVRNQISRIKELYNDKIDVIVGRINSYDYTAYLLGGEYLPDIIITGIPGYEGYKIPQMTAIYEVYSAVKNYYELNSEKRWVNIIADGDVNCSGDILKCYALGASGFIIGNTFSEDSETSIQEKIKIGISLSGAGDIQQFREKCRLWNIRS